MKKINWWNVLLEVARALIAALAGAGGATLMN